MQNLSQSAPSNNIASLIQFMKIEFNRLSLLIALTLGLAPAAWGQLQWSSYENTEIW